MNFKQLPDDLANYPISLDEKEQENPTEVIRQFFTYYNLNDLRTMVMRWHDLTLYSKIEKPGHTASRFYHLKFQHQLLKMAEAIYVLYGVRIDPRELYDRKKK